MSGPDLLVIVPTRGRPVNARQLWAIWRETCTGEADLHFAIDDDDPWLDAYKTELGRMDDVRYSISERRRMVGTLNEVACAFADQYSYLGFMGDDHRPRTRGWDRRLVEALSHHQTVHAWSSIEALREMRVPRTGLAYGNDLLQGATMPTAVVMTSDIVRALGYMAPPSMKHLCVDLVWKDWGEAIDRLTYLDDVIIEHMHPANGKAANDVGYEEVNNSAQVQADSQAYHDYRDGGGLRDDIKKLEALL